MGRWHALASLLVLFAAFAGCFGAEENPRDDSTRTQVIGREGGTFSVGTTTVTIPEGALTEPVEISVTDDPMRPAGFMVDGAVVRFGPSGLRFAKPITVSFPSGRAAHVYWTVERDETRFEQLETSRESGRLVAHPSHFSLGFVGTSLDAEDADSGLNDETGTDASTATDSGTAPGVTCISKRRVVTSVVDGVATCTQNVTTESNVHFWPVSYGDDLEGAITTDSAGILTQYMSTQGFPIFYATNATHVRYEGNDPDKVYILRSGNLIEVHVNAARGGTPPAGCEAVPLIHVVCSGATTLGQ